MKCYIESVVTDREVVTDIKLLIPDAGLRRRMSRVLKNAVATAVECVGGVEGIDSLDAIITATGWGCLADSEKFLRNMINDKEQLLNPTPFIQSTFNTVGGQIALLRHNHCYNVTYVNRSHSFEDALLDAMMRLSDGENENVLVGSFDEQTVSSHAIMARMGLFRKFSGGEGAAFALLKATPGSGCIAQVTSIDFPESTLSEQECVERYAVSENAVLLYNSIEQNGIFPTASAHSFVNAARLVQSGEKEVVVYNEYYGAKPAVFCVQCIC